MVDNIIAKLLGLVLIAAAHTVLNVPDRAITGTPGTNITLQFPFMSNVTLQINSYVAIYRGSSKIAEDKHGEHGMFDVNPKNRSVSWHITNLNVNYNGFYRASLLSGPGPVIQSKEVQLIVQEENRSSTAPPMESQIPITADDEHSGSSPHIVTILVVSPVVLLAAALPCLVWCLLRTKDEQPQSSNPTIQEPIEESNDVPAASLVYSVLDFPKRSSAVLEMNSRETEYAAVSYLPEKRPV